MSLFRPAAFLGFVVASVPAVIVLTQEASAAFQPPDRECAMSSARLRSARLASALQKGFGVQYWGATYSAETLSQQPHGLLILEVTKIGATYSETGREVFFSPEEIAKINRDGTRPTLGYLNVSEIETYRDYWIDLVTEPDTASPDDLPEWYGPTSSSGEHLAAYWTKAWQGIVLARVDRLMQTGIDGLFLDDVLHYYTQALDGTLRWPTGNRPESPEDAPEFALEMMRLVELIAARAREWKCDAYIVVNNGVFIGRDAAGAEPGPEGKAGFSSYLNAIDAVMLENFSAATTNAGTIEALQQDFRDQGVAVLSLDVLTQFPDQDPEKLRQTIAKKAAQSGFYPYIAVDEGFNQVAPPIQLPSGRPAVTE
tara:strand:- start:5440 stop:6546 length:1107 start_codon:yes stop_codon:yes gene_type:complete